MIYIKKGKEPSAWIAQRKTPGINYVTADKTALRLSLLKEQGGICGYCMRRVVYVDGIVNEIRIEHLKPRSISLAEGREEETMDYRNMILCCNGRIDDNGPFHCDRSKAENCIHFTPLDTAAMDTISYSSKDGRIRSSNALYDDDINLVLNLNHPRLSENRLAVIRGVTKELGKKPWKKSEVIHKISFFSNKTADGQLHEYCGVVIWFLKKRLKFFA